VSCLKKRALTLCSPSEVPAELRHLRAALSRNGYTKKDLSQLNSRRSKAPRKRNTEAKRVVIPFVPGLSHKVSRCFRKAGVNVVYRPPPTIRSIISRKKPQQQESLGVVYRIPCGFCSWSYVGETGRTLSERLKEHKRAVRNMSASSEISNHGLETGHAMDWSNAECLSREGGYFRRIFKEAWFSRSLHSGNRVFHDLDPAWNVFLAKT